MDGIPISDYLKKLDQAQAMLDEIKQGLLSYQSEIEPSVQRGEKDIEEGRFTVCETQKDLDNFFASI